MPEKVTEMVSSSQWQCGVCGAKGGIYSIIAECETTHIMRGAYEVGQVINNGHQTIVRIDYKRDTIYGVLLEMPDGTREWRWPHYLKMYA